MSSVLARISRRRRRLEDHEFCQALRRTEKRHGMKAFGFVKDMTFFVLGFRDLLELLKIQNPRSELDRMVNRHCDEDSDHWLWFLDDLETLGLEDIECWGGSVRAILEDLWDPNRRCVRELVYQLAYYACSAHTAQERLVVIECLEASFAAFVKSMSQLTSVMEMEERLHFFGRMHHEEEAKHAMGSWIDRDKATEKGGNDLAGLDDPSVLVMVDEIFDRFERVFAAWLQPLDKVLKEGRSASGDCAE